MRQRKYTEPTLTQPRPLQRARVHERRPEDLRPIFTMQDFLREGLYDDRYREPDWIPARDYREVIIEGPVDPKHIETLQEQKN